MTKSPPPGGSTKNDARKPGKIAGTTADVERLSRRIQREQDALDARLPAPKKPAPGHAPVQTGARPHPANPLPRKPGREQDLSLALRYVGAAKLAEMAALITGGGGPGTSPRSAPTGPPSAWPNPRSCRRLTCFWLRLSRPATSPGSCSRSPGTSAPSEGLSSSGCYFINSLLRNIHGAKGYFCSKSVLEAMTPPPRHTSPSYSTALCPGVTAHCASPKRRRNCPDASLADRTQPASCWR